MINRGKYNIESYAHILNTDRSILKLNPIIEKFGYSFMCVTASEFEKEFSEILNIPKNTERKLTIIIGREQHGISHELHHALIHNPVFGLKFMHMEYPEIILLKKNENFELTGDFYDSSIEMNAFTSFHSFVSDLLLQLRLLKAGEIFCSQSFQITSETRQISFRRFEISIGSFGDYILNDVEVDVLSKTLKHNFESNSLTELAVKNFNIVYNLPDGRIRFITLMTCLESLFNQGKEQIAHTIARHLAIILSKNKDEFIENYTRTKKLYNARNAIVHGSEHKGNLVEDYLDLAEKVRKAINYCNKSELSKEGLFAELNTRGF